MRKIILIICLIYLTATHVSAQQKKMSGFFNGGGDSYQKAVDLAKEQKDPQLELYAKNLQKVKEKINKQ